MPLIPARSHGVSRSSRHIAPNLEYVAATAAFTQASQAAMPVHKVVSGRSHGARRLVAGPGLDMACYSVALLITVPARSGNAQKCSAYVAWLF